jgi:ribosomal protein L16/L10AE
MYRPIMGVREFRGEERMARGKGSIEDRYCEVMWGKRIRGVEEYATMLGGT